MTGKSNLAQKVPADIALIVFGIRNRKQHASRFGSAAVQSAEAAAKAMGMRALQVISDEQREIARRLPKGTVSPKGRTIVPLVRPALYSKLLAIAGPDDATPTPPAGSPPADTSKKLAAPAGTKSDTSDGWSGLIRGSIVLATDNPKEGYFLCEVQHVDGENLSLIWRDWPELGKFPRKLSQVALLHPTVKHAAR